MVHLPQHYIVNARTLPEASRRRSAVRLLPGRLVSLLSIFAQFGANIPPCPPRSVNGALTSKHLVG